MKRRVPPSEEATLGEETSGAVYTEYTIILVLVSLVMAVAIAALGVPFVHYFRTVQEMIFSPLA